MLWRTTGCSPAPGDAPAALFVVVLVIVSETGAVVGGAGVVCTASAESDRSRFDLGSPADGVAVCSVVLCVRC
jgi:hypothetical protein